ncbi:TPA: YaiO family outer membrane beta-barrel protein [Escherichia coli]|jgi:YaiO family outer membrane protein|nr:YaiO family outer membrane beta-barrel protein [Escherichia coli]HEI2451564.1 YaiO family outer membrane beta-barrel protein [Escherichia coli]HEI3181168.1 YaiO family outer membrane beta-barrel protein [Escherichia coli]
MKKILIASIVLTSISASAKANDVSLNAGYEYINYSGDHGKRNLSFIELRNKLEDGNTVFNLSYGERDYGGGKSWDSVRARATVWYKWNKWLSSRTSLAVAENTPVFARKDFQQDVSLKILPDTIFTVGYRYANYFEDIDVNAWSGGVAWYVGSFIASWRYTHYDTQEIGGSYSHLLSVRMNDKNSSGYTQLWLGRGNGAYTYDWAPDTKKGTIKSVNLKRTQPLNEYITLGLSAGKQWYKTPVDKYHNLQGMADITWYF